MTSVSFFFPSIHSFTLLLLLNLFMRTFILNRISIIDPLLRIWCHSSLGNKVVSIINLIKNEILWNQFENWKWELEVTSNKNESEKEEKSRHSKHREDSRDDRAKSALEASRRFSIRWAAPDRLSNLLDASRRCPPSTLKAPLLIWAHRSPY